MKYMYVSFQRDSLELQKAGSYCYLNNIPTKVVTDNESVLELFFSFPNEKKFLDFLNTVVRNMSFKSQL